MTGTPRPLPGVGSGVAFLIGLGLLAGLDLFLGRSRVAHPVPFEDWPVRAVGLRWLMLAVVPAMLVWLRRTPTFGRSCIAGVAASAVAAIVLAQDSHGLPPQTIAELVMVVVLVPSAGAVAAELSRRLPTATVVASLAAFVGVNVAVLGGRAIPPAAAGVAAPAAPDVLLLTLDTVREDALSASPRALAPGLTPALDALAAAGCRVDGATAPAPITGPSHASMLSGQTPRDLGMLLNARTVPDTAAWLPESLRAAGYQTGAFVSSAMVSGRLGYSRGFAVFDDDLGGDAMWRGTALTRLGLVSPSRRTYSFSRPGRDTSRRMGDWLAEADPDRPVFVWLHLYDAHRPYRSSIESRERLPDPLTGLPAPEVYADHPAAAGAPNGKRKKRGVMHRFFGAEAVRTGSSDSLDPQRTALAYLGGMADLDDVVAQVVRTFERQRGGLPPAWAVVGDHGESLTEHGEIGSHQRHLFEANLRVPLLLSDGPCPTGPVSTRGVAGTLLERAGLAPDGLPRLSDRLPIEAVVVGAAHEPGDVPRVGKLSVREGSLKVIVSDGGDLVEVYNLAEDPHEILPLADPPAELVARVKQQAVGLRSAGRGADEDTMDRDALRALGYIDDESNHQ